MAELIVTAGLPGSGKSTWARERVRTRKDLVRVNKDLLRVMLHDGEWSPDNEKQVVQARDALVKYFLGQGVSVVVDDTNFGHIDRLKEIAGLARARFSVQDFTDVPIEECIRRDSLRTEGRVGEEVIRKMAERNGLS